MSDRTPKRVERLRDEAMRATLRQLLDDWATLDEQGQRDALTRALARAECLLRGGQ